MTMVINGVIGYSGANESSIMFPGDPRPNCFAILKGEKRRKSQVLPGNDETICANEDDGEMVLMKNGDNGVNPNPNLNCCHHWR